MSKREDLGVVASVLDHLNGRRFIALCAMAELPPHFTAADVRAQLEIRDDAGAAQLLRDLSVLEYAGILAASPPRGQQRQGRVVTYTVTTRPRVIAERLLSITE